VKSGPGRILDSLRRASGQTCSGEAISAELGVSRAQVWKHVETLRHRGYGIHAEPGDGYRLESIPDRLYPDEIHAGLATRWLARTIHYRESTESTNRDAVELARDGAEHGTAVIAEGQTAGRGRLGRSFHSPPYLNLYTSIVLRPRIDTSVAPTWILAAAVAVAETVGEFVPDPGSVAIKWPNDVQLDDLKTSGILMELAAEATQVDYLVLGIGVNLNVDPATFPEEFRARATSLSHHIGRPVDRTEFTRRLYGKLETVFDECSEKGFHAVRPRFDAKFTMQGRPVRVMQQDGDARDGIALGIDANGALRLRTASGDEVPILAGDVTIAKDGGPA